MAAAAIAGFAAVSIYGLVATCTAQGSAPSLNQTFLYITAALSSLVGGIFAVAFGVKETSPSPSVDREKLLLSNIQALGEVATPHKSKTGAAIGIIYAVTYFLLGVTAIVVWVLKPDVVADSIKALGATFIGMAVPIARGYFSS